MNDNRTVLETIQAANDAANAAIQQVHFTRDAMETAILTLNRSLDELHSVKANLSESAETMGFMRPRPTALTGPQTVLPSRTQLCDNPDCQVQGQHGHFPEVVA